MWSLSYLNDMQDYVLNFRLISPVSPGLGRKKVTHSAIFILDMFSADM